MALAAFAAFTIPHVYAESDPVNNNVGKDRGGDLVNHNASNDPGSIPANNNIGSDPGIDPVNSNVGKKKEPAANNGAKGVILYDTIVPPPGLVQHGALVTSCGAWVEASPGTTCANIAGAIGLDEQWFVSLNPQLHKDCAKNLWSGYFYCRAPLRIPTRKAVAGGGVSHQTVVDDLGQSVGDYTASPSTRQVALGPNQSSQDSSHDISTSLHHLSLGPKLQSLRSRFEPHAVNSNDANLSRHLHDYMAQPMTNPRAEKSRQSLPRIIISPSPSESTVLVSSEISPCQVQDQPVHDRRSLLPVSTNQIVDILLDVKNQDGSAGHVNSSCKMAVNDTGMDMDGDEQEASRPSTSYFTSHSNASSTNHRATYRSSRTAESRTLFEKKSSISSGATDFVHTLRHVGPLPRSGEVLSHRPSMSKPIETDAHSLPQSSSINVISPIQPKSESPSRKMETRKQSTLQETGDGPEHPSFSGATYPQARPSVADLRKSFEKVPKPIDTSETPAKAMLHPKPSREPLTGPQLRVEVLAERPPTSPDGKPHLQPLIIGRGHIVDVKPKTKSTRQLYQQSPPAKGPHKWDNSSNDLHATMDGLSGITPASARERTTVLSDNSQDRLEQCATRVQIGRDNCKIFTTPKTPPASSRPTQEGGKVARLRRFFERSPNPLATHRSLMSLHGLLNNNKSRRNPSSPSWSDTGSPTSTHTVARMRSIVPSLTTEISVNDFFCDFVGNSRHAESPAPIPTDPAVELRYRKSRESSAKLESPVKRRIQHFERISRETLHSEYRQMGSGDGASSLLNRRPGRKVNKHKQYLLGSWEPIHQRGAAIWRKISNSLTRSLDSWKEDGERKDGHDHLHPNNKVMRDGCATHATSRAENDLDPDFHQSGSFTYGAHANRRRANREFMSSSYTAPSLPFSATASSSSTRLPHSHSHAHHVKYTTATTSESDYDRSLPNTPLSPPATHKKKTPLIRRISSGFHWPHAHAHGFGLGLDGHLPSRPVRGDEGVGEVEAEEAEEDGRSEPLGDPNALLKVMLKQSAAERSRRRQDEKERETHRQTHGHRVSHLHLGREIKSMTFGRFQKEKGKVGGESVGGGGVSSNLGIGGEGGGTSAASQEYEYDEAASVPGAATNQDKGKGKGGRIHFKTKHGRSKDKDKNKGKGKEISTAEDQGNEADAEEPNKKTSSGFVVFESKDVKLRHPRPRRPGQVRKIATMYRDKERSRDTVDTKASSGATLKELKGSAASLLGRKASSALGRRGKGKEKGKGKSE
ncbi:hypothetical protein F4808DRAFT_467209 [Astrocystis sublimbata]|nr:hypothetical protein F4808DRAFT_467209 [Astrocystis sublimbata]